ncbi:MAG: MmcQ/YjbR family DNA-binding protein [Planctomycetota bacterium]
MTPDAFRKLALAFPAASEGAHMGHPDFRVGGKIFATLLQMRPAPEKPKPGVRRGKRDDTAKPVRPAKLEALEDWAMVKLTPAQQADFLSAEPSAYKPAAGEWGRRGATLLRLSVAKSPSARGALALAWRNTAPKDLAPEYD